MKVNPNVPAVTQPLATAEANTRVLLQVRQGMQSLAGQIGGPYDRAVTFNDLVDLGMATRLQLDGGSVGSAGGGGAQGPMGPQGPRGPAGPPGADMTGGGTMTGPLTVQDTGAIYTPAQIYHMAYPTAVFNDASDGANYVSSSYAGTQRAGIAGYVVTDFPVNTSVGWGNGVAVFGVGVAHANGAMAWGVNTLLTDSTNPSVVTSGTGRLLQNEFDFNVTSPNTQVFGLSLVGASVAQPAVANAVSVGQLGSGIHWQTALISSDNAAVNGVVLGYQGATSGNNLSSQPIILWNSDGGGARHSIVIQAQGSNDLHISGDTAINVHITGNLHVSGTIGTLEARLAALEARLAAAGL